LGYRGLISANTKLQQSEKNAAIDQINTWIQKAGTSTGGTGLTYLALGQSLGSSLLDETYLLGHELGHIMAPPGSDIGEHSPFWIDTFGDTRMDDVRNGEATADTLGILMAADQKSKDDGTTVETALRSMGIGEVADLVATKFANSGGC
jgi:hypothetical protein